MGLTDALDAVAASWPVSARGDRVPVDGLNHAELVALNDAVGALRRHVDATHARVASEIARQSRPELGADGLAKQNGYRSPAVLIAATTGTTVGDASRLVAVGEATAPRRTFSGADAPARHPHVATALSTGRIGMPAASAIITMLDRVALRADPARIDEAEQTVSAQAVGLTLDQLGKVLARAEAYLDPDGLEPEEEKLRSQRTLTMYQRDGMLHLNARLDPESGAPVRAAIEAIVTAEFRNEAGSVGEPGDADAPRRTLPQRQADALVLVAQHILGCSADRPINGPTVIIRMNLADLESGTGSATIDGIDRPISIATARRMAASGSVIPCVLGGDSEILDWGRQLRLYTEPQKLALGERDGGCAMCGLPPGMTKAHHIRWWARHRGRTDLANGVLLCETCHHRIHDNGWDIHIDGPGVDARVWFIPPAHVDARVWFIPPAHVDPTRTPRLGGKHRFSFVA